MFYCGGKDRPSGEMPWLVQGIYCGTGRGSRVPHLGEIGQFSWGEAGQLCEAPAIVVQRDRFLRTYDVLVGVVQRNLELNQFPPISKNPPKNP